jgi:hypothetical protein
MNVRFWRCEVTQPSNGPVTGPAGIGRWADKTRRHQPAYRRGSVNFGYGHFAGARDARTRGCNGVGTGSHRLELRSFAQRAWLLG